MFKVIGSIITFVILNLASMCVFIKIKYDQEFCSSLSDDFIISLQGKIKLRYTARGMNSSIQQDSALHHLKSTG
ncbi:hypothetical protein J2TS6_14680 [Paenibacillus albilobatus]|uniref:Uncharacterized protein n=1 Tax=Paenibacillus albilobatus TaxID=2716884 RepID=A0A920CBB4_9BACL|nr:hypothetical protein J2TS6_14680 [Paenibacillus albilobatus]